MKEVVVDNYEELSDRAADFIVSRMKANSNLVLGLATGSTPIGLYKNLVKEYKQGKISFKLVQSFNLDEYCGLSSEHEQSYGSFMNENLFKHVDIDEANVFFPVCDLEGGWYDQRIRQAGGIDLQILGIGRNGHIGFNEPGSKFDSKTRIIDLADSTIEDNARFFSDIEEVPRQAMTMGLNTIMEAREVLLLASGESKKEVMCRLMQEEVSEELPASVLMNHPKATIIIDREASCK